MKYAKLRSDLVIRTESSVPGSSVVVKDALSRRFYRFSPVQSSVLRRLDGLQDFESLAAAASSEAGVQVTPAQVEAFVSNLQRLRLLDHPETWKAIGSSHPARHRLLGSLLSIKIHAVNPDRILTRLERRFRFVFSSWFHWVAALSIAAACAISVCNAESLFVSLGSLLTLQSVPIIFASAFVVLTLHEFAHGITLKHFGGKVEEMGLLFLYFLPAFYCNVDDAWLLPKRKRILVSLAGGYCQITVWAWATIAWRLLAEETAASTILLVIIGFSGIQTLFNFNPLIKLDGYYILSDFLEIPNLRPRAFRYLRLKLKRVLLGPAVADRVQLPGSREGAIYGVYGVASLSFTAGLLWISLQRIGGWLVQQYQTWGMLLVAAVVFMAIPNGSAGKEKPEATPVVQKHGSLKKFMRPAALPLILLTLSLLPWELKVTGDFTIMPNKRVEITAEVEGALKAIYVEEGSRVRTGEVLAELENLDLSNSYEETRGELGAQQATLDLLKAGTRQEEIDRAKSLVETKHAELASVQRIEEQKRVLLETVAKREAEVKNAQGIYERSRILLEQGLVARADNERDQTAYNVQQKELQEALGQIKVLDEQMDRTLLVKRKELVQAESELKILLAGSRKESIKAVEAQVNKLMEKQAIYARQLGQLKIRSTMDGIVSTPYLRNRIGEYLNKGDGLCEVVSWGSVIIDMPVAEKEIADVRIGFPITLKVRGFPHDSFEARVKSISPVAVDKGTEKKIVVQGELENLDATLRSGMTGVGKILCGKRMIINLVTRRAIRWLRTEFWEYIP